MTISYDMIYRQDISAHTRSKKNSNILGIFQLHSKYFYVIAEPIIKIKHQFQFQTVNGPFTCRKRATFHAKVARLLYANNKDIL